MRVFMFSIICLFLATATHAAEPITMQGLNATFAPVVEKVAPTVVNISTKKVVRQRVQQASPFANDPFFQMFFGNTIPGITQDKVERSLGSGVIVRSDGLFITNFHVVEAAQEVQVSLSDGREFTASYVDGDKQLDLAIMRINTNGEKMPFARLGNSDQTRVGDVVLAIGNPFGVGQSVSMGIISALGRGNVGNSALGDFIQTDAAINPGNSGGALVSASGEVIGINSAIFTRSGGSNGIGFAIPANAVRNVVESVIKTGEVQRGWFGASGQDITQLLASKLELKTPHGVLINEIAEGSPAHKAGLKIGDIIIGFNGVTIKNAEMLQSRILTSPVERNMPMLVSRAGEEVELTIRLITPPKRKPEDQLRLEGRHPLNGYLVEQIGPALAQQLDLSFNQQGVVVIQAAQNGLVGLIPGDLIEKINDTAINTLGDLQKALDNRTARTWNIVYRRKGRVFRMVIRV